MAQQDNLSWQTLVESAKQLQLTGKTGKAAAQLEAAWKLKPKKTKLIYQAGDLYQMAKDYHKAAECFQHVLDDHKQFPKVRFQYAQALKQNGQYDEALPQFLLYLNNYDGKDHEAESQKVQQEIAGVDFAIQNLDKKNKDVDLIHLDEHINTPANEFAPIPFSDDILYFSATHDGKTSVFHSEQVAGIWTSPEMPTGIEMPLQLQFGNGSFSPGAARFYFTGCKNVESKDEKTLNCQIYMMKRQELGWSKPLRLRDYINLQGAITTHPFVMQKGKKEILFFSSDRKGGYGGMDIWYSIRDIAADDIDFDAPKNLGSMINTSGDEVTPYFDGDEETLYFSSNGRATMGGLDIFKSKGAAGSWATPENLGVPYNSGADDLYYIKNQSKTGGYFVSNRNFGMEKISSRDEDIFGFTFVKPQDLIVKGIIQDKIAKSAINDATVSLYEIKAKDDQRLLTSMNASQGNYQFTLLPDKRYHLEVEKDGYQIGFFEFNMKDSAKNVTHAFYLEKYVQLASIKTAIPKESDPAFTPAKKSNESLTKTTVLKAKADAKALKRTDELTLSTNKIKDKEKLPTLLDSKKLATPQMTVFKVQLLAYKKLDLSYQKRLQRIEDLGDFDVEDIDSTGLKRMLIGDFDDFEEAVIAMKKIRATSFKDAFIVKYVSGTRVK